MIGSIKSFDIGSQIGIIDYEDDLYEFHLSEWSLKEMPKEGESVDFIPQEDGTATNVGPVGKFVKDVRPVKNHYVAGFLGLFLGFFGLHRIYLGFYLIAAAQIALIFFNFGMSFAWGFIEGGLLLTRHIHKDAKGRPLK